MLAFTGIPEKIPDLVMADGSERVLVSHWSVKHNSGNDVWGSGTLSHRHFFLITMCGTCYIWRALVPYFETNIDLMSVSQYFLSYIIVIDSHDIDLSHSPYDVDLFKGIRIEVGL